MATEFICTKFPDGEVSKPVSQSVMLGRVGRFVPVDVKCRLRLVGSEWGPWRTEKDLLSRVKNIVVKAGVGPKLIIQRENDREMLSVREVAVKPDLGANPAIEAIHWEVWPKFPVRSGGLWLCRYIDGTRTVSKHGFQAPGWKGSAEDIFVTEGGMSKLIDVAKFIVDRTKKKQLNASTVIVDNDIWTPQTGWRVYGGQRHYHVHTDASGGSACNP
jgi:hypothetical protein